MHIKNVASKKDWENFLLSKKEKTFLQSWSWGKFQKKTGHKIWRLGVYEEEELIGCGLVIKMPIINLSFWKENFLLCPHGPVVKERSDKKEVIQKLSAKLREIGKREKSSFIRLTPLWPDKKKAQVIFKQLKFRQAPLHLHPPQIMWQLDIRASLEELLKKMRKTTRYLVKKGMKIPNLKVFSGIEESDLKEFVKLYKVTVRRHHFAPFSLSYLKNELAAFNQEEEIKIFSVKFKGKTIASAIIIFWQNIAFYHQGASSDLCSNKIPGSYLLQWKIIQEAKRKRFRKYNLWGIAPSNRPNHPWNGLSSFKKGFGGYKEKYIPAQDFVLSSKYWPNYVLERCRKIKRKL